MGAGLPYQNILQVDRQLLKIVCRIPFEWRWSRQCILPHSNGPKDIACGSP